MRRELLLERLSSDVIGAFYEVYNTLRFGFLEAVYVRALEYELALRGIPVEREAPLAVTYKGTSAGIYRADLLVDGKILVEVKATRLLDPAALRQTLNYLRCSHIALGLVLHFGPRASFHRVVLERRLPEP